MPTTDRPTTAAGSQLPDGWGMTDELQFAPGQEAANVAVAMAVLEEAQAAAAEES